jgi:hypothetical protein
MLAPMPLTTQARTPRTIPDRMLRTPATRPRTLHRTRRREAELRLGWNRGGRDGPPRLSIESSATRREEAAEAMLLYASLGIIGLSAGCGGASIMVQANGGSPSVVECYACDEDASCIQQVCNASAPIPTKDAEDGAGADESTHREASDPTARARTPR